MTWPSAIAIYFLIWWLSIFLVLPFGVKTAEEAGVSKIPGQADSAPAVFRPGRIVLRVTIVATIFFAIFLANYEYGWITPQMLDWYNR